MSSDTEFPSISLTLTLKWAKQSEQVGLLLVGVQVLEELLNNKQIAHIEFPSMLLFYNRDLLAICNRKVACIYLSINSSL